MDNEFLTEYVFDTDRIKDGVIDFKTDIALRGDIALCKSKGNHKYDKLIYLFAFLMNIPKELYSYSVEVAKEYFDETDVDKLSAHIVSRTPIYYLYYGKVLADLNGMQIPTETKKSTFCRYIEDIFELDGDIAKNLLLATLDSYYTYLQDIASIYLREVNSALENEEEKEKTEQEKKAEFFLVVKLINDYQINKSPTLTKEKETELGRFLNRFAVSDDSSTGTERAVKSFVSFLESKGVDVNVEEQTFDDNGEMIDIDDLEELNDNIENVNKSMEELSESIKDVESILKSLGAETSENPTVYKKVVCSKNVQIVKKNKHKQFRVVKINRFTGAECDWSEYFDTIEEAQQWKENCINKFPQLVEKFVFNIEVTGWKE